MNLIYVNDKLDDMFLIINDLQIKSLKLNNVYDQVYFNYYLKD